jgi:protein TonB
MATMSGSALLPNREPGRKDELFAELVASNPTKGSRWRGFPVSVTVHVLVIGSLVLVPILWPEALPDHEDYVRALIYNPPPPPPPPQQKGSSLLEKIQPTKKVTPDTLAKQPELTVPDETPRVAELKPEDRVPETEQSGAPDGVDNGVAEGLPGGVEGGVVGGVWGGVLGGCVGCTGDGPVMDYDQPPKPIKITRPTYPQEAFVKKIEGTVVLEILIDASGRVVRARVVTSIPLLDAAAIQTVYQWTFSPAIKGGRPVATLAHAPVQFRIY